MEEHLWTPAFWRWISYSTDNRRLQVLQKVILHKLGESGQLRDNAKKLPNLANTADPPKKVKIRIVFPKDAAYNSTKHSPESGLNSDATPERKVPIRAENKANSVMNKSATPEKWIAVVENSDDSQIIYKLVMDKFKHVLNYYHQRSVSRSTCQKRASFNADVDQSEPTDVPENGKSSCSQNETKPKGCSSSTDQESLETTLENDLYNLGMDKNLVEITPRCEELARNPSSLNEGFDCASDDRKVSNSEVSDSLKTDSDELEQLFGHPWAEDKYGCGTVKSSEEASLEDDSDSYASTNYQPTYSEATPKSTRWRSYDTYSINTSQVSTLISKSQRHNTVSSSCTYEQSPNITPIGELRPADSKESLLIQEHDKQHMIITQISKALNFCLSSKHFKSSAEYVEAERILLLATQKYEAVLKELQKAEYEYIAEELTNLGRLEISNLTFALPEEKVHVDRAARWFVAIVSHDTMVLTTDTAKADRDDIVRFPNCFRFEKLDTDFGITVSVYALSIKNHKGDGYKSKLHTKLDTSACLSPYKFINLYKNKKQPKKDSSYEPRRSSFVLYGATAIRITDFAKPSLLKVSQVPNHPELKGIISMDLSCSIQFTRSYSGFLTTGSENNGTSWNRRWVCLDGHILKFWNYPADQQCVQPVSSIDLSFCASSYIARVHRELCARPYTLLLETRHLSSNDQNSSYKIVRHYLAADNLEQMDLWEKELNSVVSALRRWNGLKYSTGSTGYNE